MMHLKIDLLLLVAACVGYAVTQNAPVLDDSPMASNDTSTADTKTVKSTSTSLAPTTITTAKHSPTTSTGTTQHSTNATTHTMKPTTEGPTTTAKPLDLWAVKDANNTYCILLRATFLIDFKYKSKTTNATVPHTISLFPGNGTTVKGSCGSKKQSIEISFFTDWTLTLVYERTDDKSHYYQNEVGLVWDLNTTHISDAPAILGDNHNMEPMFNTSKTGYLCLARMKLYNNATEENGLVAIYTEQLKFEAFQTKHDPTFSDQYERCKEDTISNLVPIIVGACLGGLIIIVLIAYLIGRRRSRRGYESV